MFFHRQKKSIKLLTIHPQTITGNAITPPQTLSLNKKLINRQIFKISTEKRDVIITKIRIFIFYFYYYKIRR